jgi:hypothetical protein
MRKGEGTHEVNFFKDEKQALHIDAAIQIFTAH